MENNDQPHAPTRPAALYVSGEISDGVLVTARVAAGYSVRVRFHDDGTLRDVTEWIADLVAVGLVAESRRANALDGAPEETVTIADVEIHHRNTSAAGSELDSAELPVVATSDMIEAWVVTPANRSVVVVPLNELLTAAADGIAAMVLDAVAENPADVPDDASSLGADTTGESVDGQNQPDDQEKQ